MKQLCVPATLDALEEIGKYVLDATSQAGLSPKAAYGLRLAVDEIATNIITHGYDEAGGSGDVVVNGELTADTLTIVLEDTGVPFNPLDAELPGEEELSLPLEERAIGGLGIMLVLKGVDSFDYQHVGGRNRNIFVMNRTAA